MLADLRGRAAALASELGEAEGELCAGRMAAEGLQQQVRTFHAFYVLGHAVDCTSRRCCLMMRQECSAGAPAGLAACSHIANARCEPTACLMPNMQLEQLRRELAAKDEHIRLLMDAAAARSSTPPASPLRGR